MEMGRKDETVNKTGSKRNTQKNNEIPQKNKFPHYCVWKTGAFFLTYTKIKIWLKNIKFIWFRIICSLFPSRVNESYKLNKNLKISLRIFRIWESWSCKSENQSMKLHSENQHGLESSLTHNKNGAKKGTGFFLRNRDKLGTVCYIQNTIGLPI